MGTEIEIIREDLTRRQRADLVTRLNREGFRVTSQGHVEVVEVKNGHPHYHGASPRPCPLPVGFLHSSRAELVNTDETFPEDYHAKLRDIYRSV